MSCERAETTTLLWLYGELESSSDHAQHVASCADCTAAVELHSEVAAVVAPLRPVLEAASALPPAPMAPANNRRWFALLAMAAAVLCVLVLRGGPVATSVETPELAAASGPVLGARASIDEFDPDFSDLDERLDALEADLDLL